MHLNIEFDWASKCFLTELKFSQTILMQGKPNFNSYATNGFVLNDLSQLDIYVYMLLSKWLSYNGHIP